MIAGKVHLGQDGRRECLHRSGRLTKWSNLIFDSALQEVFYCRYFQAAHQHHQRGPFGGLRPPARHEAVEENAVKDHGQPNCETTQEIGHDDDGNSKPRRNVIRVVDDLSTNDGGGGNTDGWKECRWGHGTVVDKIGSEQKDADSDACA